jgi:hypothetical protein
VKTMKTRFNYWGPRSVRRAAALTPGVLDRRATEVFTRGQCHSFALALQRLTGWGLIGMYHDRGLTHLAVVEPLSGLAVDAERMFGLRCGTSTRKQTAPSRRHRGLGWSGRARRLKGGRKSRKVRARELTPLNEAAGFSPLQSQLSLAGSSQSTWRYNVAAG